MAGGSVEVPPRSSWGPGLEEAARATPDIKLHTEATVLV